MTDRLHELDQIGLVVRKQDPEIYKKVEYSLVDVIPELTGIFKSIQVFATKLQEINKEWWSYINLLTQNSTCLFN